jgi:hypothetical protein
MAKTDDTAIEIRVTVSEPDLADTLVTAGESGSGYWARTELSFVEALTHKAGVEVFDAENPKVSFGTLTRDKLLKAPGRMIELCRTARGESMGLQEALGALLCGDTLDGPQADLVVQVALFGDVKFG